VDGVLARPRNGETHYGCLSRSANTYENSELSELYPVYGLYPKGIPCCVLPVSDALEPVGLDITPRRQPCSHFLDALTSSVRERLHAIGVVRLRVDVVDTD
jgi:hypothetical protein